MTRQSRLLCASARFFDRRRRFHSVASSSASLGDFGIAREERVVQKLLSKGQRHPNVLDLVMQFVAPGHKARGTGFILPSPMYENPIHVSVTEYLGGGSLADAMVYRKSQGEIFKAQQVLDVARAASRELSFLHRFDITHQDVKPLNFIYSTSLAETASTASTGGTLQAFEGDVGTPGSVAPGVLRCSFAGKGDLSSYGPSCDVFSLGCVLYEMLVGAPPTVELLPDSARAACSLPRRLFGKIRSFVESLLAVDPAEWPESSTVQEVCLDVALLEPDEGERR